MTFLSLRRCLSRKIPNLNRSFSVTNYCHSFAAHHQSTQNYLRGSQWNLFEPKLISVKFFSNQQQQQQDEKNKQELVEENKEEKPGLVKRFKQMYRDYWYVLVPVHLITSAGWFGGFYYIAKSGVDIVPILQSMGISDRFVNPLKDSSMGYLAISYALYKIATPFRYTLTLGGTTLSINYLKNLGYIKPVPSKEKIKEMYIERRDQMRETFQETKQELRQRKDQLKERKDNIMGDYVNFKKELKDIKTKKLSKMIPTVKDK